MFFDNAIQDGAAYTYLARMNTVTDMNLPREAPMQDTMQMNAVTTMDLHYEVLGQDAMWINMVTAVDLRCEAPRQDAMQFQKLKLDLMFWSSAFIQDVVWLNHGFSRFLHWWKRGEYGFYP